MQCRTEISELGGKFDTVLLHLESLLQRQQLPPPTNGVGAQHSPFLPRGPHPSPNGGMMAGVGPFSNGVGGGVSQLPNGGSATAGVGSLSNGFG